MLSELEAAILRHIYADICEFKARPWFVPGQRRGCTEQVRWRREVSCARDNGAPLNFRKWCIGTNSPAWRTRRSRALSSLEQFGLLVKENRCGRCTAVFLTDRGLDVAAQLVAQTKTDVELKQV